MLGMKYPDKKFVGFDLSEKNIEMAKEKYSLDNISYILGNAVNEFDLQEKIDLVYSFSFIQYFNLENSKKLSNNIKTVVLARLEFIDAKIGCLGLITMVVCGILRWRWAII